MKRITDKIEKMLRKKIQHMGLDLGTHGIKLVEVLEDPDDDYPVKRHGVTSMPIGAFAEGVIKKPEAVTKAIKNLMDQTGLPQKSTVNLGITGKQVIVRQLRLPQIPLEELEGAVRFEAEKYIPTPMDQLFLDYTILGEVEVDGVANYSILVAAAPQKIIYTHYETVKKAGLKPIAIDVEPLALYRFWRSQYFDSDFMNQAVINVGHSNSHLVIFKGDTIQFTRVIPLAGKQLTEAVTQTIGKEVAAAEESLYRSKVVHISQLSSAEDIEEDDKLVRDSINNIVAGLASEIQRSIDFYQMQAKVRLDRLVLTGGTANLAGVAEYLEADLNLPVVIGSHKELDPTYSLACGLAIREMD